jgi:hypothetical protein
MVKMDRLGGFLAGFDDFILQWEEKNRRPLAYLQNNQRFPEIGLIRSSGRVAA